MKKVLSFSIVWTVLAFLGAIAMWNDPRFAEEAPRVRWILSGLPVFGVWFIWWSWRRVQRYRSVRVVKSRGRDLFVWTELDGGARRDRVDPRIEWDKDDRMESNH